MPYEVFWDGPIWHAVAFRKAYKRRREQRNFDSYVQGAYIYDALCRVAPALNAFSKSPKPMEWLSEPYDLGYGSSSDRKENIDDEPKQANGESGGVGFMLQYMSQHNQVMRSKSSSEGGA